MSLLLIWLSFIVYVPIATQADYYYVNKILSRQDAEDFCQEQCNSHLLSIHSASQFSAVLANIPDRTSSSWVWIGLYFANPSFEWTDETQFDYDSWSVNEPSNTGTKQCVIMTASVTAIENYKWETEDCSKTRTFMCNSCHYTTADNSPAYHINPSIFAWDTSQSYCETRCNSHLSSIHSERDNAFAKYLSLNSVQLPNFANNVSIGLFKQQSSDQWNWTDHSVFNFGNDITNYIGRPYPWANHLSQDTDAKCVRLKPSYNYEFFDGNCSDAVKSRFMCNSCDSVLNKYVVINMKETHSDANVYCQTVLNASLASVHSEDDYLEAQYLCQLNNNGDCHIGLTTFDTPDTGGNNIVLSAADGYVWKAVSSSVKSTFICNLPSQLCDESDWDVFGDNGWDFDTANNCNVQYSTANIVAVVMTNKQFINKNGELTIELIYSTTNVFDSDSNSVGVMLFNMDSICDYYYVSVTYGTLNTKEVLLGKVTNGIYDRLAVNDTISFAIDVTYVMKIRITNGNTFLIYINNNAMIEYSDLILGANSGVLSGYIGIKNHNIETTYHSLHVSGAVWIYDSVSLNTCNVSMHNTIAPTNEPTSDPTPIPTHIPTYHPTNTPTNNPTIEPSYFPTVTPIFFQSTFQTTNSRQGSASVDESISTTMISVKNTHHSWDDFDVLFLHIIYGTVAIIMCCLISICILVIICVRKKHRNVINSKYEKQNELELEQTKPVSININIKTNGFTTKRQLTTDNSRDSVEQMYGEPHYFDDENENILGFGDTPITVTETSTHIGNENILNESSEFSSDDSDSMKEIYEKSTNGNETKK